MAVKLRLARKGSHKKPFFWVVASDSHMPRDGRFIEKLGVYNPVVKPTLIDLKTERINEWLDKGAQPTDPVREILRSAGILKARAGHAETPAPEAPAEAPAQESEPAPAEG